VDTEFLNKVTVDIRHSMDTLFFLCASAVKNGGAVDTWHSRNNSFFSPRLCGEK
jgi:hypothetical protein